MSAVNDLHGLQKQQQLTIFTVSRNLKNDLIEAKLYKLTESVIPQQTLFQHQLGYVWPTV